MATKKQCLSALPKGATLHDNSGELHYDVGIEAPRGMNWGDIHERVICENNMGNKAPFWNEVLAEIKQLTPEVCNRDNCEGMHDYGHCEWWSE